MLKYTNALSDFQPQTACLNNAIHKCQPESYMHGCANTHTSEKSEYCCHDPWGYFLHVMTTRGRHYVHSSIIFQSESMGFDVVLVQCQVRRISEYVYIYWYIKLLMFYNVSRERLITSGEAKHVCNDTCIHSLNMQYAPYIEMYVYYV